MVMFVKILSIVIIVVNSFVSSCCVCRSECDWFIGVLRDLDGLPVLYCLKSETCRMTSNDGRSLLSQCKMVGSATGIPIDSVTSDPHGIYPRFSSQKKYHTVPNPEWFGDRSLALLGYTVRYFHGRPTCQ